MRKECVKVIIYANEDGNNVSFDLKYTPASDLPVEMAPLIAGLLDSLISELRLEFEKDYPLEKFDEIKKHLMNKRKTTIREESDHMEETCQTK